MNKYSRVFQARCPNNGIVIEYTFELFTADTDFVMVEEIVEFCGTLAEGYHEALAALLFERFGRSQRLKAHHHGVDIETTRGPLFQALGESNVA